MLNRLECTLSRYYSCCSLPHPFITQLLNRRHYSGEGAENKVSTNVFCLFSCLASAYDTRVPERGLKSACHFSIVGDTSRTSPLGPPMFFFNLSRDSACSYISDRQPCTLAARGERVTLIVQSNVFN